MEKVNKLFVAVLVSLTCLGIFFPKQASAERISLEWRAPTQQCDGSAQALTGLARYNIYYSRNAGRADKRAQSCTTNCRSVFTYTNVVSITDRNATTAIITVPQPGTYSVTMTAVNTAGEESCYSNEVSKVVTSSTPNQPLNFEISFGEFGN